MVGQFYGYTYTLTHDSDGALVETEIPFHKLDKTDVEMNPNSLVPEMVAFRARECAACVHVADAINEGATQMKSLVDGNFDWLQFKVG